MVALFKNRDITSVSRHDCSCSIRCRLHPPCVSIEGPERTVPFSRTPFRSGRVFYLGSQKFVPARRLRAYGEGSPGDGSHVSAIRVRLHPLPYIPSCRWIPGAHNGEHAKGGEERRGGGGEGEGSRVEGAKKICGKKRKRAVPRASIMGV